VRVIETTRVDRRRLLASRLGLRRNQRGCRKLRCISESTLQGRKWEKSNENFVGYWREEHQDQCILLTNCFYYIGECDSIQDHSNSSHKHSKKSDIINKWPSGMREADAAITSKRWGFTSMCRLSYANIVDVRGYNKLLTMKNGRTRQSPENVRVRRKTAVFLKNDRATREWVKAPSARCLVICAKSVCLKKSVSYTWSDALLRVLRAEHTDLHRPRKMHIKATSSKFLTNISKIMLRNKSSSWHLL
jgi:hypothetical protein